MPQRAQGQGPKTPALLILALLTIAPVMPALGQGAELDTCSPEIAPEGDIELLKKLDQVLAEQRFPEVTVAIEDLMRRSRGRSRNLLVPQGDGDESSATLMRDFESVVLERLLILPANVRKDLASGQDAAVRGLFKGTDETQLNQRLLIEIVENYPLAERSRDAAETLAELAFEDDDIVATLYYDNFLDRFHTLAPATWSSYTRKVLTAARSGRSELARSRMRVFLKKAEASGQADIVNLAKKTEAALEAAIQALESGQRRVAELPAALELLNESEEQNKIAFWETRPKAEAKPEELRERVIIVNGRATFDPSVLVTLEPPRFHPIAQGNSIYLSNGRRLFVHDAKTGRREAVLPFYLGDEVKTPPPPGMEIEAVAHGSFILSHLNMPRSSPTLARSRVLNGKGLGRDYGSLFIFDAARGHKVVFWEGDRGPTDNSEEVVEAPAEDPLAKRSMSSVLANGHLLGKPALCGRRVYAALLVTENEAEVWVVAFERGGRLSRDTGLQLQPLWATFVASCGSGAMEGDRPTLFPSIEIHQDKLFVPMGGASLAALDAIDGSLRWIARTVDKAPEAAPVNPRFGFRPGLAGYTPPPSAHPLGFVARPGGGDLVLIAPPGRKELTAFDAISGRLAWTTRRQRSEATHFFVTPDGLVLRYGAQELVAMDGASGKLCSLPVRGQLGNYKVLGIEDKVSFRGDIDGNRLVLPAGDGYARFVEFDQRKVGERGSTLVEFRLGARVKLFGTADDGHVIFTAHGLAYATKDKLYVYGPPRKG